MLEIEAADRPSAKVLLENEIFNNLDDKEKEDENPFGPDDGWIE